MTMGSGPVEGRSRTHRDYLPTQTRVNVLTESQLMIVDHNFHTN